MNMPNFLLRLILTTLCVATPGVHSAAADASLTDDGLAPIQAKNLDKAWKRPGASLAGYQGIHIRPVTVAFAEHWDPRKYGRFGLASAEVEKIRSSLAQLAGATFSREMQRGGYTVATAAGENVLDVEVQIVDLYVNGPDTRTASDVRYYVLSAGEMRVLVTLRDSITGTALYRASDFQRGQETGRLEYANEIWNRVEAERALNGWARQVKRALDAAKTN
jgi:Protein of unknown function (DUF3313)